MNCNIITTSNFEREAKPLIKKYHSLKQELKELEKQLLTNPAQGTPLGNNCYKIRLAVKSKGKGKSGGLRVITYIELDLFVKDYANIFLLSIYDKSDTATISKQELKRLITSRIP